MDSFGIVNCERCNFQKSVLVFYSDNGIKERLCRGCYNKILDQEQKEYVQEQQNEFDEDYSIC